MGVGISKVDDGLFICGVNDLHNTEELHSLGIKYILNVAQSRLYDATVSRGNGAKGETLRSALSPFKTKIIGANDHHSQSLQPMFHEMAEFIAEGRSAGGVVVHCAAGISRAASGCLAYLMIKEEMGLEPALTKLHTARHIVHPNEGFWCQLRDLEAELLATGKVLRGLCDGELEAVKARNPGANPKADRDSVAVLITELERSSLEHRAMIHLTVQVHTRLGQARAAETALRASFLPAGMSWDNIKVADAETVDCRMSLSEPGRSRVAGEMSRRVEAAVIGAIGDDAVVERVNVEQAG